MAKRWPTTTSQTLILELKVLWPLFVMAGFAVVVIIFTAWYTTK